MSQEVKVIDMKAQQPQSRPWQMSKEKKLSSNLQIFAMEYIPLSTFIQHRHILYTEHIYAEHTLYTVHAYIIYSTCPYTAHRFYRVHTVIQTHTHIYTPETFSDVNF